MITGASGLLGTWLCEEAQDQGFEVIAVSHKSPVSDTISSFRIRQDLCEREYIPLLFDQFRPQCVIHAAALADTGLCEDQPLLSKRVNVEVTRDLAQQCADRDIGFTFLSTDLVFDGEQGNYSESDSVNPINRYGEHKAEAEHIVQTVHPASLILRLPFMFGFTPGKISPLTQWLKALEQQDPLYGFRDEVRSPVDYRTAAHGIVSLSQPATQGILHLGGIETLSRLELMRQAASTFGYATAQIEEKKQADMSFRARRPRDTSLDSRIARQLGYKTPFVGEAMRQMKPLRPS